LLQVAKKEYNFVGMNRGSFSLQIRNTYVVWTEQLTTSHVLVQGTVPEQTQSAEDKLAVTLFLVLLLVQ